MRPERRELKEMRAEKSIAFPESGRGDGGSNMVQKNRSGVSGHNQISGKNGQAKIGDFALETERTTNRHWKRDLAQGFVPWEGPSQTKYENIVRDYHLDTR